MTTPSIITQKTVTGTISITNKSTIQFVLNFHLKKHPSNRPEKVVNIEREKYRLPLPEKKTEEEDVYVYQVSFGGWLNYIWNC